METLGQFCPDLEIYSIDEAFLSIPGFRSKNFAEYAAIIRSTVKRWTGIPVSIGIAETKTLAKIAGDVAKPPPGGVFDLLTCCDRESLLAKTTVADVWGIGKAHSQFLHGHDIRTALELRQTDDQFIRKHIGIVGLRLVMEPRGCSAWNWNNVRH